MYNAANQQVSYNDFVNASKQNQPIPVVNTIKTTIIPLYIIHIVHF